MTFKHQSIARCQIWCVWHTSTLGTP